MGSIRRLTDKTLEKYKAIVADGGTLTPRQQKAFDGHALITNEKFVEALLRPDLAVPAPDPSPPVELDLQAIKARLAAYDEALEAMKEEGHTEGNQQIYQLARVKFTTHSFPDIDMLVKRVEDLEAGLILIGAQNYDAPMERVHEIVESAMGGGIARAKIS